MVFSLVYLRFLLSLGILTLFLSKAEEKHEPPVHVYVLAGQNNMEGKGSVQQLKSFLQNNLTRANYQHLVNENNEFIQRDNVLVYFPETSHDYHPLAPGLGNPMDRFGPELEFGHVVGDAYRNGNTLIIKTCWGGKDLAVDFRPPSRIAGGSMVGGSQYTDWQPGQPGPPESGTPIPQENYHKFYNSMVDIVIDTLGEIEAGRVFEGQTKWELKGLVWWQGWNDLLYPAKVMEYEDNLKALIRNIRHDFSQVDLPVVLGELGQSGLEPNGWMKDAMYTLRRSIRNVALSNEFRETVRYARTSTFYVENGDHYDGVHNYYGRADTIAQIGRFFGQTMLQLLEDIEHQNLEEAA